MSSLFDRDLQKDPQLCYNIAEKPNGLQLYPQTLHISHEDKPHSSNSTRRKGVGREEKEWMNRANRSSSYPGGENCLKMEILYSSPDLAICVALNAD